MRLINTLRMSVDPRIRTREKLREFSRHMILITLKFLDTFEFGKIGELKI